MRIPGLIGSLILLAFCACTNNPVVDEPQFSFDDATGQPLKVVVSNGGTMTNPSTTISIGLPEPGELKFTIHNCTGQRIVTLVDGHSDFGEVTLSWDAKNESGEQVKTGIYVYRLQFEGTTTSIIQYKPVYFLF